MSDQEIRNARIESTMLGVEDHGILTCSVHLDYGGTGQSFGGFGLDEWVEEKKCRCGTAYGMEFIRRVLGVVGVERWEDLPGKHVRVKAEYCKVHALGNILKDEWFCPETDMKEFVG